MTAFMRGDFMTDTNHRSQCTGEATMATTGEVEQHILQDLERRGPCSIEEMVTHLSGYTWNQVFSVVDRLNRNAKVMLQHPSRFGCHISLAQVPRLSAPVTGTAGNHHLAGRFDQVRTTVKGAKL